MPQSGSSGRSLWVASAGGHLTQARLLWRQMGSQPSTWVTYDVPHARTVLRGEEVVYAYHPTTKNLTNAVRNYRLARALFRTRRFARVISTGAAVAVPFMLRARQLGLPCHYIESATRVDGPSLSGRMLAALPDVQVYRQSGTWGGRRWRRGPSVFDGYTVARSASSTSSGPRRAVVSLGTQRFPFPALVERVRDQSGGALEHITWQLGSTPDPGGLQGRVCGELNLEELEDEIRAADVVIGHCGVGLALTVLSMGKVPVLVPRRRHRGEHTDDHQAELARELARRGLAVVTEPQGLTHGHLEEAERLVARWQEPPEYELTG